MSNQDGVLSWLSSKPNLDFTQADHEPNRDFYREDIEPTEFLHHDELRKQ